MEKGNGRIVFDHLVGGERVCVTDRESDDGEPESTATVTR